ncbi:hypothetical protein G7K_4093-t1 [Saitoella complicata NRRL Y-17804]|uniref:Uncharacterized protein n=1 Tax=Saitoella complicata (strain BCRC 22490 / CBS 7301 / JCM 7358 / NBRC 10748 / NRRL Y-17804) TaxID=698492 RepID=A0A0E9NJI2_SAICN|nr:hypothetical protein G7K_4093-t1 [Saitoella complicata NRRL Y-17804]
MMPLRIHSSYLPHPPNPHPHHPCPGFFVIMTKKRLIARIPQLNIRSASTVPHRQDHIATTSSSPGPNSSASTGPSLIVG